MQLIKCLAHNKPNELLVYEDALTITDSINGTALTKVERALTKPNLTKIISYLVLRTASNFNVGKNITPEQAGMIAYDMVDKYKWETLEDIVLMFKYARQGKIGDGKNYNLDQQTILHSWMPQFLELKAEQREIKHTTSKGDKNWLMQAKWDKNDVQNLETSDKPIIVGESLGNRMKKLFQTPEDLPSPLKTREDYLKSISVESRRMTIEQLRTYLIKMDVKNTKTQDTIPYDADVETIIKNEIDRKLDNEK